MVRRPGQHLLRPADGARAHGAHHLALRPAPPADLLVPRRDGREEGRPAHRRRSRGVALPDGGLVLAGRTPRPPIATASHTPTWGAPWWWLSKVANIRPATQNVGSPCETFSEVPGRDPGRCSAAAPAVLRGHVPDEPLRRILAPLADQRLLGGQQIGAAPRVQPVGVGPALVHAAPRIGPVVVDLAAQQVPPHAP